MNRKVAVCVAVISFTVLGINGNALDSYHAWHGMQGDGQPQPQMQPMMPINPQPVHQQNLRAVPMPLPLPQCEPEGPIGKRSVGHPDSFPNLANFFNSEEGSDVKLVVNGTKYPAHKFVLSAKSHKFAELFRSDPTKAEWDLGDESEETFKIMLRFFYTETFHMDNDKDYETAIQVFNLAQKYEVMGLRIQVERALARLINMDNYIDILKFAEDNQMHELIRLWMNFVFSNSQPIVTEEKFVNESNGVVRKVLSSLNVPSGYVLSHIKRMMEADRSITADDVRPIIKIDRCTIDDLIMVGQMALFDYKFLFEDMIKRYQALVVSCQRPMATRRAPVQVQWVPNRRVPVIDNRN